MGFDILDLAKRIFEALKGQLDENFIVVEDYVEFESKKIADTLAMIEKRFRKEIISEEEAKFLLQLQINYTRNILLTAEGIGFMTADHAISAAMASVKDTVNEQIGFILIL